MYRTTSISPAELLFNGKIKTKLPELNNKIFQGAEEREMDARKEVKGKNYYDKQNNARVNQVKQCN